MPKLNQFLPKLNVCIYRDEFLLIYVPNAITFKTNGCFKKTVVNSGIPELVVLLCATKLYEIFTLNQLDLSIY